MPISYSYPQYTGIWKLNSASGAKGAGTWPVPPSPHLYAWGQNNTGQLGIGNTTYRSSPNQVGSLSTWLKIASGYAHVISLKTDGTLWSWGQNNAGQLGLGNTTYYSSPKQIGALTTWTEIAAGTQYSAAIKTDGTLWIWGSGSLGKNGLGNTTSYSSPKQIGALTNWAKIALGNYNALAIKTDGTLWSWGYNVYGQLGLGNTTYYIASPSQVGGLTSWAKVATNANASFAIKTDGTLWSWGINSNGVLGLGNSTNYSSPKQVGVLTNWNTISVTSSSCATKTDGTLWTWGINTYGQLGTGNTTYYSSPKQIGSLTNWLNVVSIYRVSMAGIKTDGTLWTWGRNTTGQLALGNTTNYSSPKQVGALATWTTLPLNSSGNNYCLAIAVTA